MKLNRKKTMIIAGIVGVVVLLGIFFLVFNGKKNSQQGSSEAIPTDVVIPTVDSSVVVNLKQGSVKGEVLLTIKNAPSGTKGIDFELSYNAQNPGDANPTLQGAIGSCKEFQGVWECGEDYPKDFPTGKKIVLGTCSSGTCRYHNVIGKIKVTLRFSGGYGEKIFEKDFGL